MITHPNCPSDRGTSIGNWDGVGGDTIGAVTRDAAAGQLRWDLRNFLSSGAPSYTSFHYGALNAIP